MRDAIEEFLTVLIYSVRTQIAIYLGILFFIGITFLGEHMTSQLNTSGQLGPAMEVIKEKVLHQYDKVAYVALFGFLVTAIRMYRRDRKRILGL
ncbi:MULTISPECIES: hypothetical protein [Nitrosomonas]|uniref:Uncharacterized protein n=1 Tax=Nitrosomonas communis TaxID=44574 RepID=A0A0F7KDN9_9PROT|nr:MULTISPECIES: hypothetical protein [Nitrosomonas]AKH36882.1 hypothetical protein AAW31_02205 [Nitrosomonas communis]TYP83898.1 hypothetical protein BCL69_104024 [Nitrosomonas communis]UVS61988.1 hypothetical protein NX761_02325 [Nitrosomonas sp. PLL12]